MNAAVCESEPTSSEPIAKDRIDWSTRNTPEGLEEITRHFYDWSQQMATLAIKHLAGCADQDAIRSAAGFALLDAVRRFDPTRGIAFRTFATLRIRGAIFDELRKTDSLKRSARALINARQYVESKLMAELGRNPTQEEICEQLGWTRKEFLYSLTKSHQSIDNTLENDFDRPESLHGMLGKRDPVGDLERSEAFEHMMRGFTMEEKTLMYLYYYREATMKTIGTALGIGQSRVSQLHSKVIKELRQYKRAL